MDPRIALMKEHIRDIPDFPKPGILFRDITPLLASPKAFGAAIDLLVERYQDKKVDHIVAVESRGFIFGGPLALRLGIALTIVRKPGKLPFKTHEVSYELEYGTSTLQIHQDALKKGARVVILDDLLATGGTAAATCKLAEKLGAKVVECAFAIELEALKGRENIPAPSYAMLVL
ncbi:MAG: adenine phosphoribosyltransferase [Pseudomonadota bacterium]